MLRDVILNIAEKLESERDSLGYYARECLESRRKQLRIGSKVYCMLSYPDNYCYCTLQKEAENGLAECLKDQYLKELGRRGKGGF